jgi:large subunit ribosomal protein L25
VATLVAPSALKSEGAADEAEDAAATEGSDEA